MEAGEEPASGRHKMRDKSEDKNKDKSEDKNKDKSEEAGEARRGHGCAVPLQRKKRTRSAASSRA